MSLGLRHLMSLPSPCIDVPSFISLTFGFPFVVFEIAFFSKKKLNMGQGSSHLTLFKSLERLSSSDVSIEDNDLWIDLLTTGIPVTYADIAMMMPYDEIRRMRLYRPGSLASLLYKCTEQIHCFVEANLLIGGTKYSSMENSFKPLPTSTTPDATNIVSVHTATRCLHIIRRVMPVVLEKILQKVPDVPFIAIDSKTGYPVTLKDAEKTDVFNEENVSTYAEEFFYHVLQNNLTLLGGTSLGKGTSVPNEPEAHKFPVDSPLSILITNAVVGMSFIPNHTISTRQQYSELAPSGNFKDTGVLPSLLWLSGISRNDGVPSTKRAPVISQRRHVIKTLQALLSGVLYSKNPGEINSLLNCVADSQLCPLMPTLVCSLLNTIVNYTPYGTIAFTSHLIGEEETLVFEAAQLLGVLFDCMPFYDSDNESQLEKHAAWKVIFACGAKELKLLLSSIRNLIVNRTYSRATRTPNSQRTLRRHDEFLILLFKILERCPGMPSLLASEPSQFEPLVMPLLDFVLELKRTPEAMSRCQLALFLLVRLCSCRQFVVLCNSKNAAPIPLEISLSAGVTTTNDLIVITMLTMLSHREDATPLEQIPHAFLWSVLGYSIYKSDYEKSNNPAPEKLSATVVVHETCTLIISNITPYMTSLSDATSVGLFSALKMALNPTWITLHPTYPTVLQLLVESIASSIQYQQQASKSLMYLLAVNDNFIFTAFNSVCRANDGANEGQQTFPPAHVFFACDAVPAKPEKFAEDHAKWGCASVVKQNQELLSGFQNPSSLPAEVRKNLLLGTLAAAAEAAATLLVTISVGGANGWKDATFVGTLPPPHQILQRTLPNSKKFDLWMTSVLWGLIFATSFEMTDGKGVQLFQLKQ